jgi:hypothetical protein
MNYDKLRALTWPHLTGVIRAKLADFQRETPRIQRLEHRLDRRGFQIAGQNDEIVALFADRDEAQAIGLCGDPDRNTGVGVPGSNRCRHLQMPSGLEAITLHSRRVDSEVSQRLV